MLSAFKSCAAWFFETPGTSAASLERARRGKMNIGTSVNTIRVHMECLRKRNEELQKRVEDTEKEALVFVKKNNKEAARQCLGRKLALLGQIARNERQRSILMLHSTALETMAIDARTIEVMKQTASGLRPDPVEMTMDRVADVVSDVQEALADAQVVSSAIDDCTIRSGAEEEEEQDPEQIEQMLNELETARADSIAAELDFPSVPSKLPSGPTTDDTQLRDLREMLAIGT